MAFHRVTGFHCDPLVVQRNVKRKGKNWIGKKERKKNKRKALVD